MQTYLGFFASILSFYFLLRIYSDTRVDILQQPISPQDKQMFFIDPALNSDKRLRDDLQCQTYQNLIMEPKTQKLGDVFNLNVVPIHNRAFEILILIGVILLIYVALILGALIIVCVPSSELIVNYIMYIAGIVMIISSTLMTLGLILLLYFFFSSDSGEYSRFLECRNVNYLGFAKFRDAETLRSDFYLYLICNIINMIINYSINKNKKKDENKEDIKTE